MRIINGHTYESFYQGVVVFVVDNKDYYTVEGAANALGLTVEDFKKVW